MSVVLSVTGLFKTILYIIGALVLLRFIGQIMIAKRNINEQNAMKEQQSRMDKERRFVEQNKGKISISRNKSHSAVDVDYEEVK
ncbi:MAG: hypothetical protein K0R65_1642 [Crocinitomicaceae bacterium]|jgi:hypothetical protein|nr:hypothetical protein [Crocinitomicaceae bacterium]